ncbi:MAG: type III secretion system chaperone, partial [Planctomycetaceae bacterium]
DGPVSVAVFRGCVMPEDNAAQSLLDDVAQQIGVGPLKLDAVHSSCNLNYQDRFEVSIVAPPYSDDLYLAAPIIDIDPDKKLELFERVLQLNYLVLETDGATFAIDDESAQLILCAAFSLQDLTAEQLVKHLENFIQTSAKHWEAFNSSVAESVAAADEDPGPGPANAEIMRG